MIAAIDVWFDIHTKLWGYTAVDKNDLMTDVGLPEGVEPTESSSGRKGGALKRARRIRRDLKRRVPIRVFTRQGRLHQTI